MKTKKLFLKLFLTAFFMSVFLPKDAQAAVSGQTDLDISKGNIYIGGKVGYYDTDVADATSSTVTDEVTPNSRGYTITGTAVGKKTITIDVSGALSLSFNKLDLGSDCQIIIKRGDVTLALYDRPTTLHSDNDAIVLKTGSSLTIQGSGQLAVTGGGSSHAIKGEAGSKLPVLSIKSGEVTLNRSSTTATTDNLSIQVSGGILNCFSSGHPTELGSDIIVTGGVVNAAGIAKIDYANETITDIPTGANVDLGTLGDVTSQVASNVLNIKEAWYGATATIGRQKLQIPSRKKTASGARHAGDENFAQENDGSISNIDLNTMEYIKTDTQVKSMTELAALLGKDRLTGEWQRFSSAPVATDLAPGYYYVRKKGDNTAQTFATDPTGSPIIIKKGKTLKIEPVTFEADFGYAGLTPPHVLIRNYGASNVDITKIEWANNPSNNFTYEDAGNKSIASRTPSEEPKVYDDIVITPKGGLTANTSGYKAKLTISYRIDGVSGSESVDITFKVKKAEQPAPSGLTVTDTTYNTASLSATANPANINKEEGVGIEYSYSTDGLWNSKNTTDKLPITGLTPGTKYTFLARYKGTANFEPSNAVTAEGETEYAATVDYENKKLVFAYLNREYTVAVGSGKPQTYAPGTGKTDIPDEWCGKTITVTDTAKKASQTIPLPAIGKAPAPKAIDEQIIGDNGKITNVSDKMEYRKKVTKNGWSEWTDCSGKTVEEVPGEYQVRYKATSSAFPSAVATVTIHKGPSIDVQLSGNDFDNIPYGTTPADGKIIIQNRDTIPVTLEGITLSAQDFVITEGSKELASGAYVEWGIRPKDKLDVGTYESEIIVSYDDGQILPDDPAPDEGDDNEGDDNEGGESKDPDEDPKDPDTGDTPTTPDEPEVTTKAVGESEEITTPAEKNIRTHSVDVTATIVKAPHPEVPPVPAEKNKTATSITLESIPDNAATGAKVQYSRDGGRTWQDSPTFTGLSPNREYTFVTRYGETDNYEPSDTCDGEVAISTLESNSSDDNKKDPDDDGISQKDNNSNNNGNDNKGTNGSGTSGNGTNGSGTSGNGTNGSGTNGNGTNGSGTSGNGTNGSSGSSSGGVLSSAKTGDLNNIQLWVALMIGSYLSCAIIIKSRLKKSNS